MTDNNLLDVELGRCPDQLAQTEGAHALIVEGGIELGPLDDFIQDVGVFYNPGQLLDLGTLSNYRVEEGDNFRFYLSWEVLIQ